MIVQTLLNTYAEASLITEAAARTLSLRYLPTDVPVSNVKGCLTGKAHHIVECKLESPRDDTFSLKFQALVLPRIAKPGEINLLLGADICGHLLLDESRRSLVDEPVAPFTPFGWIIMGPDEFSCKTKSFPFSLVDYIHLRTVFSEEKFWDNPITLSKEKAICHCLTQ